MSNGLTITPIKPATYEDTPVRYVPFEHLWHHKLYPGYLLSEWWTLLPYKDKVIVVIDRLDDPRVGRRIIQGVSAVNRVALLRKIRQLPRSRWINTVRFILMADSDEHAADSLLQDVKKQAIKKHFSVESMVATETTSEYIARYVRFVPA